MKFRKKPLVIEAIQLTGTQSLARMINTWQHAFASAIVDGSSSADNLLFIATSEGLLRVNIGDWVIKGIKGEFYSCKPDIFEAIYEAVDEP